MILTWLVAGLIAGLVASQVPRGHGDRLSVDILIGLLGSVVGGVVFYELRDEAASGFSLAALLVALATGALALGIYRLVAGRKR